MGTTRRPKLWIGSALAALALATLVAAQGASAQADPAAEELDGVVDCNGTTQAQALFRSNDIPATIGEMAAPVQLPAAVLTFNTPVNSQILVTFTGQAFLNGLLVPVDLVQPVDEMQVTVLIDGVEADPADGVTFNTDAGQHDALEACRRVGQGNHTVRVLWQVLDPDANNVVTGTMETWSLHVEINPV